MLVCYLKVQNKVNFWKVRNYWMLILFYGLVSGDLLPEYCEYNQSYHAVQWLLLFNPNKILHFISNFSVLEKILLLYQKYFWCLRNICALLLMLASANFAPYIIHHFFIRIYNFKTCKIT